MDLSSALTNEQAWQIVDARRFAPSPPLLRAPGNTVAAEAAAARDELAWVAPPSFERNAEKLALVRPPAPGQALRVANAAARAFVDGKLAQRTPTFDAVDTVCLRDTRALSLAGARAGWYQQPVFHRRIAVLLHELGHVEQLGLRNLELDGPRTLSLLPGLGERVVALDLSCNALHTSAPQMLLQGAWHHLEVLHLGSCGLDDTFLRHLPAEQLPALRVLQLRDNAFSAAGLDVSRLTHLPALRGLGLASCGLRHDGGLLGRALARLALDFLNLRDNPAVAEARTFAALDGLAGEVCL